MRDAMSQKKYLENGGSKCPACRSDNISCDDAIEADGGDAWASIRCDDCNASWTEYYTLKSYGSLYTDEVKVEEATCP